MILFSDYQIRRWMTMLDDIMSYQEGTFPFRGLVASLEGECRIGNFDHELSEKMSTFCFNLEVMNAVELDGGNVSQQNKENEVKDYYRFLRLELVNQMISAIDNHLQTLTALPFSQLASYFMEALEFGRHLVNATEWELWIVTLDTARYDVSDTTNEREVTLAQIKQFLEAQTERLL